MSTVKVVMCGPERSKNGFHMSSRKKSKNSFTDNVLRRTSVVFVVETTFMHPCRRL